EEAVIDRVELVSDDRVARFRQVGADLMTAPGAGVDVEQRVALEAAHHLEVGPRPLGSLAARAAPVDDIQPARDSQGLVESAPLRLHCPAYQRSVSLRDLPRREAVGEEAARLDRSRHEE